MLSEDRKFTNLDERNLNLIRYVQGKSKGWIEQHKKDSDDGKIVR